MVKKRWTQKELDFLQSNYNKLSVQEIADALNRGYHAVAHKANRLGLVHPDSPKHCIDDAWTENEDDVLRALYPHVSKADLRDALPGRTDASIYHRANRLGLSKETYDCPLRTWTHEDLAYLAETYPAESRETILSAFPDRTWEQIANRACVAGIYRDKDVWTTARLTATHNHRGRTQIEVLMYNALLAAGLDPVEQYLLYDKFIVDIALPEYRIAIECDGDYWHGHPSALPNGQPDHIQKHMMHLDKGQNAYFTKLDDWLLLRFWEHEIKDDIASCIARIRARIET